MRRTDIKIIVLFFQIMCLVIIILLPYLKTIIIMLFICCIIFAIIVLLIFLIPETMQINYLARDSYVYESGLPSNIQTKTNILVSIDLYKIRIIAGSYKLDVDIKKIISIDYDCYLYYLNNEDNLSLIYFTHYEKNDGKHDAEQKTIQSVYQEIRQDIIHNQIQQGVLGKAYFKYIDGLSDFKVGEQCCIELYNNKILISSKNYTLDVDVLNVKSITQDDNRLTICFFDNKLQFQKYLYKYTEDMNIAANFKNLKIEIC